MKITPEIEKKCDELMGQYPKKKSAAMMMMHLIQEKCGYFDDEAILFVAGKLGVEPIEIYGMLTFYPMFTQKPRGRIHIKVCRTLSCALAGSVEFGRELAEKLNCPVGSTSGIYRSTTGFLRESAVRGLKTLSRKSKRSTPRAISNPSLPSTNHRAA